MDNIFELDGDRFHDGCILLNYNGSIIFLSLFVNLIEISSCVVILISILRRKWNVLSLCWEKIAVLDLIIFF